MDIEGSYNFRRIDARLSSSGVVGEARLRALAAGGYRRLINLLPDDSQQAVANERQIVEAQGLAYVHIPVDFAAPQAADFAAFCAALEAAGDEPLHLHCAANYRVSAFYARHAVQTGRWTRDQAWHFIDDLWDPAQYPAWAAFLADLAYTVLYRWRVASEHSAQFVAAWETLTLALRRDHGAFGSRLHRGDDGLWYAYARWPDARRRAVAFAGAAVEAAAQAAMQEAIIERLPEVELAVMADQLVAV